MYRRLFHEPNGLGSLEKQRRGKLLDEVLGNIVIRDEITATTIIDFVGSISIYHFLVAVKKIKLRSVYMR